MRHYLVRILKGLNSHTPLLLGGVFFLLALSLYFAHFGEWKWPFWEQLSDSKSAWGQFGDFMGGLVNPILALLTIWLLTRSLSQNSEMLSAAKEELKLAREEIARGIEIQRSTEAALQKQIDIAQQVRQFDNTLSMINVFQRKGDEAGQELNNLPQHLDGGEIEAIRDSILLKQARHYNQRELLTGVLRYNYEDLLDRWRIWKHDARLSEYCGYAAKYQYVYELAEVHLDIFLPGPADSDPAYQLTFDVIETHDEIKTRWEAYAAVSRRFTEEVDHHMATGTWLR